MSEQIEEHVYPRTSRLEAWRNEIEIRRSKNWPYRKIADWLREQKGLVISKEAIRKFCLVRKISKGASKPKTVTTTPTLSLKRSKRPYYPKPRQPIKRIFEYDDSEPIDIHNKKSGISRSSSA